MPFYEFRCPHCGAKFEELCGSTDHPACPKCGSLEAQRLFSAFATKSGGSFHGSAAPSTGGCAGCGGGSCASCH
jgi:putative FmdB family regulatory protein